MRTMGPEEQAFLAAARRVVLATIAPDGRPRPVPACIAVAAADPPVCYSPIDDKPKDTDDPRALARVRDLMRDPRITLLADRWDEDWSRLAWLRCDGIARLLEPDQDADEHRAAVGLLRARYPQYATHALETRPILRIEIERVRSWGSLAP